MVVVGKGHYRLVVERDLRTLAILKWNWRCNNMIVIRCSILFRVQYKLVDIEKTSTPVEKEGNFSNLNWRWIHNLQQKHLKLASISDEHLILPTTLHFAYMYQW